jgi:hypothetical protein
MAYFRIRLCLTLRQLNQDFHYRRYMVCNYNLFGWYMKIPARMRP